MFNFKEVEPGKYWGVYRHHDGYLEGAGQDLMDAIQDGEVNDHMNALLERCETEYEDYSYNDIINKM